MSPAICFLAAALPRLGSVNSRSHAVRKDNIKGVWLENLGRCVMQGGSGLDNNRGRIT